MSRFSRLAVALCCLAIFGCGSKGLNVKLYPVNGKVIYKGKPVSNVTVQLVPVPDPANKNAQHLDRAFTGKLTDTGEFQISAPGGKAGAPVGKFKVVLRLSQEDTMKAMMAHGGGKKGLEKAYAFPKEYMSADTSKKEVQITAENNDLLIELVD